MQAAVLLKWTIELVPERSTIMIAFTIIAHWSWKAAKNDCQSKIDLQKKMAFKPVLVTNLISICLRTGMSVKVTRRYITVKTIHQGFWKLPFHKPKSQFQDLCCLCHKNEVCRRRTFMWCWKEAKKFNQPGFSRVYSRKRFIRSYAALLAIAVEWKTAGQMENAEFVFKRIEKSVNLLPKLDKWSQPKKN